MDEKYQDYLVEKAECGGSFDFPTFKEWLDPEKAERERQQAREDRFRMMDEEGSWDLY
tara:strand:+ start:283 stop:456 length:174 start_codon:yes stop_codon:yes gene_type:complete